MRARVSVIIPVWRDAEHFRELLSHPTLTAADELIVAATHDEIDELAALVPTPSPVRLVASPPGRAAQMNAGAAAASGDWLVFLHVDSKLPVGWMDDLMTANREPDIVGGAFRFALASRDTRARVIEWGVRQRVRWFNLPYGDQGLFVRRAVFNELGGYRRLPIMEDVEFVRRLRRRGRLHHSHRPLVTSARRWEREGWIGRTLANWSLMTAYSAGVAPGRLARAYARRPADGVAVLARDPHSTGKTRLWQALRMSPDPALMQALLVDTVAALQRVNGIDGVLVHTGSRTAMSSFCPPGWSTIAQRGNDLGERMSCAFDDLFARGYARVALVGSDLPTLPDGQVRQALRLIRREADVVLGPAEDGGFYLIALRTPQPALFEGIQWGTPHVLDAMLERARALRLRVRLVERWYDVDDVESLRRAAADGRAVHTAAWSRANSVAPA